MAQPEGRGERWKDIVEFWFEPGDRKSHGFMSSPEADAALVERFGVDPAADAAGEREQWLGRPRSCLA